MATTLGPLSLRVNTVKVTVSYYYSPDSYLTTLPEYGSVNRPVFREK